MPVTTLGSVDINYLQLAPEDSDVGTLPEVVLIHGLAANLSFWYFSVAPLLARVARVTLFDLRGHGRSSMPPCGYRLTEMAEDLAHLLDYLDIHRPHLVGHSLGGAIMADFASRYPQRPASLTFADVRLKLFQPSMTLVDWPQWEDYQPLLEDLGVVLDFSGGELGYQLLREMARLHWRSPEQSAQLQAVLPGSLFAGFTFTGKGGKQSARQLLTLLETTTVITDLSQDDGLTIEELRGIPCPVLAVYGSASQTLPTLAALQQVWTHLTVEMVADAGHFFPTTQPNALLQPLQAMVLSDLGVTAASG